jgi:serine/threonine protein kinase/dipeptidyl aminopeptidase/acylaminoacyl peptidase
LSLDDAVGDVARRECVSGDDERLLRHVESILTGSHSAEENAGQDAIGAEDRPVISRLDEIRRIAEFHHTLHSAGGCVPLRTWGDMRVCRLLGQGAFADVYLAHDPALDRDVALKLYRAPLPIVPEPECSSLSREDLVSVLQEGRLMARVRHPNVVTVHGAEEINGQVGIWMDYIEGRTLAELLQLQGTLSAAEATLIALDLCRALAAVHAVGILHRDVKAQNVMRERGGRIVLMDFGVGTQAKCGQDPFGAGASSVHGTSGTPLYMAPESLLEGIASAASDIYSLGVLLFHLVTNAFPVSGSNLAELIEAHRAGRRRLLRDVRSDVPAKFAELLERALCPDPEGRYSSMGEMERAFAAAAEARVPAVQTHNQGPQAVYRQVTFTGRAIRPAPSPDGKTVAYIRDGEHLGHALIVQDISGGRPLELFRGLWLGPPRWSPDGSELLFGGRAHGAAWPETFIMPRFGGSPRHYLRASSCCWLPDGSGFAGVRPGERALTIVNRSTGSTSTVPLGQDFLRIGEIASATAPGRFLFENWDADNRCSLWVLPGPDRAPHKVVEESQYIRSISWSRDGSAIYFLKGIFGARSLFRLPLDRVSCRPQSSPEIVLAGLPCMQVSISGNGRVMAYERPMYHNNLWSMTLHAEGGQSDAASRALTHGTFIHFGPAISPDGQKVAVCRRQGHKAEIHVIRLADCTSDQITFLGALSSSPAWSPDGSRIAFISDHGGGRSVWIMDGDGSGVRRLGEFKPGIQLSWAPSERILCQMPDYRNFKWLDPGGGEHAPLLHDDSPGFVWFARASPDQRSVAVCWNRVAEKKMSVWTIPADGSAPRVLYEGDGSPVRWASDSRSIWVFDDMEQPVGAGDAEAESSARSYHALRIPADGGKPLADIEIPFGAVTESWDVDISCDGSRLVSCVPEEQSDIWVVERFERQDE